MNIGFDLDGIFIDKPPLIPKWLLEQLYKGKSTSDLHYRVPGKTEQIIRKLGHLSFLRPPIKKNLNSLSFLEQKKNYNLFLITSRFGFLKNATEKIEKKYYFSKLFKKTFLNLLNEQPHEFKNRILHEQKIDIFVDDDLPLLEFLSKKNPEIMFYWLNEKKEVPVAKNLFAITDLLHIIK